jgi:YfiH family protein
MPSPVVADNLARLACVAHGFFTRQGGVSRGIYASLNCGLGSRDAADLVKENRARVAAHLGASSLLTAYQVHGSDVLEVDAPWGSDIRPKADAMVTATRGVALGVLTADCAPVLLADASAGVVAAAHVGWRGAIGGVVDATVGTMERLGANRAAIQAAVGPAIGPDAYEVGFDFETEFLRRDPASSSHFSRRAPTARPHFDLPGYVAHCLSKAGVAGAQIVPLCTYREAKDFFSYRRSQALEEADYGRQISAIVLT